MRLYIIRHGETDWNKKKKLQGQTDTMLNDYGRELAAITGKALSDIRFSAVYSSPLKRAYETAQIICAAQPESVSITTDDRLKEIAFGIMEGVEPGDRPLSFADFFKAPLKYIPPENAESYEELCSRTSQFIEEIIVPLSIEKPDINVLISGHAAMNKSLIIYLKGLGIGNIWDGEFQRNCSINIFDINGHDFNLIEEGKIYYDV